ncbi:hypothetical protein Nizo1840_1235 [Lactiplantibacillus plantarum]|nr:hypothetical protein SF2A35B_2616 [Lactiplantibacillus plantarum]KZT78479.1 hypothetical protein Nizo1839_2541 [Lactiplantibacillus plantarum]KZT84454.1 hypothetical protein Nizo1840_1235 [Lactiplantibacillus plantarum]KZU14522.1 hypothetical protein Nizo2264_1224 [Lactiplantibacillus plantarum]
MTTNYSARLLARHIVSRLVSSHTGEFVSQLITYSVRGN